MFMIGRDCASFLGDRTHTITKTRLTPMQDVAVKAIRVALYGRVSTDEQRDGQTIDSQISELDGFARDKGWPIAGVYKDDGWSGGLLARPELDHLRDDAGKDIFDAVLINDVDRLARDVSHLGIVKRDLERRGIKIIFKKLPNEISPTHNLMVNILGSFAEFERELILDRTRRGRRHKVEVRQEYLGSNAPYGYRYTPKDRTAGKEGYLDIVAEEAAVVRQMFEWIDKEGLSARQVTARLDSTKIRPRRGGAMWGKSSVIRILRSETYAGVWHYNKYEGCEPIKPSKERRYRRSAKGSLRRRPKSEWIPVVLPERLSIVARDQWQRVQEQLNRNIAFSPRNSRHRYLLSGLVECGGCGARYCGDPNHGRFYYRCYARCKRYPSIRDEVLDEVVWNAITEAVLNPSLIAEQLERRQKKRVGLEQNRRGQGQELETARAELSQEESRIIEAYRQRILSPDQLSRELNQLKARKSALDVRLAAIEQEHDTIPFKLTPETIVESCQIVARGIQLFAPDERQRFLRLLVDRVVFEGDKIRIKAILPISQIEKPQDESALTDDRDQIAAKELHRHSRNSVASNSVAGDWIATMESYRRDRSSVTEIGFEFAKFLPEAVPLRDKLTPEFLRRLLQHHPSATLAQFSDELRIEYSIEASPTALCRAFKRAGLDHSGRSRFKLVARMAA
jgi:site-specific DNA recombinase